MGRVSMDQSMNQSSLQVDCDCWYFTTVARVMSQHHLSISLDLSITIIISCLVPFVHAWSVLPLLLPQFPLRTWQQWTPAPGCWRAWVEAATRSLTATPRTTTGTPATRVTSWGQAPLLCSSLSPTWSTQWGKPCSANYLLLTYLGRSLETGYHTKPNIYWLLNFTIS